MKIISNKLYEEYTKTTIDYHTKYKEITKEQLYDTFKFHCQGQRLLNEIVDYIYNLIQKDKLKDSDDQMNKEDYFKYYIQGSDHYLIPKDIFEELFNEMINWKEESQRQKEVIDKAIEFTNKKWGTWCTHHLEYMTELQDILKEVK